MHRCCACLDEHSLHQPLGRQVLGWPRELLACHDSVQTKGLLEAPLHADGRLPALACTTYRPVRCVSALGCMTSFKGICRSKTTAA